MPRKARIKPEHIDTFVHVFNRAAGEEGLFPFGNKEKKEFIRRLLKLNELFVVDVTAFEMLSNHFHILLHVPSDPPSLEETAERYERYYGKAIDPKSRECAELAPKLRDFSEFMRRLEQPFSQWFNRSRDVRRRGPLWAERFKNTILETGEAVWSCWKYIEMNAFRANLVSHPGQYRYGSFGSWRKEGRYIFQDAVEKHVLPWLRGLIGVETVSDVRAELNRAFEKAIVEKREERLRAAGKKTRHAQEQLFTGHLDRRVRHWVDGLIIGSKGFLNRILSEAKGWPPGGSMPYVPMQAHMTARPMVYAFKQPRAA